MTLCLSNEFIFTWSSVHCACHHNLLLIINHKPILVIHKDRILGKKPFNKTLLAFGAWLLYNHIYSVNIQSMSKILCVSQKVQTLQSRTLWSWFQLYFLNFVYIQSVSPLIVDVDWQIVPRFHHIFRLFELKISPFFIVSLVGVEILLNQICFSYRSFYYRSR